MSGQKTTSPLTEAMLETVQKSPTSDVRRGSAWALGIVVLVAILLIWPGNTPIGLVLTFAGSLAGILAVFACYSAWFSNRQSLRALEAGEYVRYTGLIKFSHFTSYTRSKMYLRRLHMGDCAFRLHPEATLGKAILDADANGAGPVSGTAVYVAAAELLLAAWDERGALIYRHPNYDPANDPEVERPVLRKTTRVQQPRPKTPARPRAQR